MSAIAISLLTESLKAAVVLALPVVCLVATIGVAIGIVQTIVQVQDQNVAFAPKLAAVALVAAAGGPAALEVLRSLLVTIISALPLFARA